MKQIKIKRIAGENFKGLKKIAIDFTNVTRVFGRNATGKTTINDLFTWVMFNKDSKGVEKFNLRPIDKNGVQIDFVEIYGIVVLEVDGVEISIEKTQKQNWVTKRGTATREMQGNVNEFKWNSEPVAEKVYKEKISAIVGEDLFKQITNPMEFPSKKWQDQRELLMKFAVGIKDTDIQKTDKKFAVLDLENHTADGLLAIAKDTIAKLKKEKVEIPIRIDEISKSIVDVDAAEMELKKNCLQEQIAEQEAKLEDFEKVKEEQQAFNSELMKLEFAKTDLINKENAELLKQKQSLFSTIQEKESQLARIESSLKSIERTREATISNLESAKANRERLLQELKEIKERTFDEHALNCKYCGQELPVDKKEELVAKFETAKQFDLDSNKKYGLSNKANMEQYREEIEKATEEVIVKSKEADAIKEELMILKQQRENLPDVTQTSDSKEYLVLLEKEQDLKEKLITADTDFYSDIKAAIKDLQNQLFETNAVIRDSQKNDDILDRIEILKTEIQSLAQQIADQEQKQFLIEDFIRTKTELLSDSINKRFQIVNFKLFDMQINGGIKETCECTVSGVPYNSLNSGHRIVAGLDIINTLSELYGVSAPIFIDNAESINSFNIPKMDAQLILLSVSDDKEMVVVNE